MSTDAQIQNLIEGRCNALRVTEESLDSLLDEAEVSEHIFYGKELLMSFKLICGFTVTGRSAVIDPSNFDLEIGRLVATKNARDQLWQLEGYRLNWDLYERGLLSP